MKHRPSWVVMSPATLAEVRKLARGASFVEGTKDMVAAYDPEPGAHRRAGDVAQALSRSVAGLHYAATLAPVADDPDHGIDEIIAYEGGHATGSLRVGPADLAAHLGLAVPGLERSRRKLGPADLALTPMPPKARRGEAKLLGFTVAQWKHSFQTVPSWELSYLVDGARRSSYEPVLDLLASKDASERLVAARLLYFADADAAWCDRLEAALAAEKDEGVRGALRATLENWRG
jgi:hypothetical protein